MHRRCIRTRIRRPGLCLAASVYEAAFAAITIGEEETLAQEWIDHSDPNRPFKSVRKLTLMGMQRLGIPEAERQAKRWYVHYSQLCMPKHMNMNDFLDVKI